MQPASASAGSNKLTRGQASAAAILASHKTARSFPRVGSSRLGIAAELPMQACRRPCHCFRGPPYPTALGTVLAVPAQLRRAAKKVAEAQLAAAETSQERAETSSDSLGAAEHTLASADILPDPVDSRNLAAADTRNMAVRSPSSEVGTMAH